MFTKNCYQHEKVCKFRPYICPYIECDHKLAFGAVVDHVMPQVMSVPGREHVNGEILDNKVVIT